MYSLNLASVIGFVTENPTIRQTDSGVTVTDLNIEARAQSKRDGQSFASSLFINATLWRGLADIASKYVKKGTQVFVSGRLETDSWEDGQGNKKYKTRIVADNLIILTPKEGALEGLPESLEISGGVNCAQLIGNLTKDPELKTTPNGNNVTSFSIATNRQWKNQNNEMQDKTEYHNVVAWGELASQMSKHIGKGKKVYISGRIQTRSWDAPDGQKRYTTEIVANEVKLLGLFAGEAHSDALPAYDESSTSQGLSQGMSPAGVPEIKYESDIKPEDLPF